jgi:histidinol phosphatase-like enzyme/predicted kinase
VARAHGLRLTDADRAVLDEHFPSGKILRKGANPRGPVPLAREGEVVLIMGLPAAGKTTAAQTFVAQGYARLNRDDGGGSLRGLLPAFTRLVESGASRIVLDNTYVSRKSRAPIVRAAAQAGLSVRCVWLSTTVEDAQVNAASRTVSKYGRLLGPDEMRRVAKDDVSVFGPGVQFRYQRELEPPQVSEGFSRVDIVPFERWHDSSWTKRAVLFWCDGVLVRSRSGLRAPTSIEDVEILAQRAEILRRYAEQGWVLLGVSWRPDMADGTNTVQQVDAVYARMQELLGVAIDVQYCPHAAGPPVCWCRKPLPGLGVLFINRHRLAPSQCVYVGHGSQDPGFARRLGFAYRDADAFFG